MYSQIEVPKSKVMEIVDKIKDPILFAIFIYLTSVSFIALKDKYIKDNNNIQTKKILADTSVAEVVVEKNKALEIEKEMLKGKEEIVVPPDAECIVNIPSINLVAKCKHGTDEETLKEYAGIFRASAGVGEIGNFAVCAHNNIYTEIFRDLYKVQTGDDIQVITKDKKYIYEVTEVRKIEPTEMTILNQDKQKAEITLITCTNMAKNRIVVKGILK